MYGGGNDSAVNGNTNVLIDGATITYRLVGGGYGTQKDCGIVTGNTKVQVKSGTLSINSNSGESTGHIFAGGYNDSQAFDENIAAVAGNTSLIFGGDNSSGIKYGKMATNHYYAGSYQSSIGGDVSLTFSDNSTMCYQLDTTYVYPVVHGGGYEDTIKGTVDIIVSGGDNLKWRDDKKEYMSGIDLYMGGMVKTLKF